MFHNDFRKLSYFIVWLRLHSKSFTPGQVLYKSMQNSFGPSSKPMTMHVNIPHLFYYWSDLVVHLLLLKSYLI